MVSIEMPEAQVLRASLLMYLVPLVGMLAGLLLAGYLSQGNEGLMALGSLLGLLVSGLLLKLTDKRLMRIRDWQPRIIAVNDPDMMEEETACTKG